MKAKKVYENINFDRDADSLDKLGVGKKHAPGTAHVLEITDTNGARIEHEYDRKKFLQNIQNGLYPSNFYVVLGDESVINQTANWIAADKLRTVGYTSIYHDGKYYELG